MAAQTYAPGREGALQREAGAAFDWISRRSPDSLPARMGLGTAFFRQGPINQALYTLREAVRRHPEAAAAWHNLARVAAAAGQGQEARAAAAKALRLATPAQRGTYRGRLAALWEQAPLEAAAPAAASG